MGQPHDRRTLLSLLPEGRLGTLQRLEPIETNGLSDAAVYAATTSCGAYILRVQGDRVDENFFRQHLRILRRAAEAKVAPALVHVDEAARAIVCERIAGVELPVALAEPANAAHVVHSLVERLRVLHALDPSDIAAHDLISWGRGVWQRIRSRPGFPPWAAALAPILDSAAEALAQDSRRVVSHYDVNPSNVLWDGSQAWLIDWETAGLGHPYYDLAMLATFLRLDDEMALKLISVHDGAPPDARAHATFRALRPLPGVLVGLAMLEPVGGLRPWSAPTKTDAPSLLDCDEAFRSGALDIKTPRGLASFGLAMLADAIDRAS